MSTYVRFDGVNDPLGKLVDLVEDEQVPGAQGHVPPDPILDLHLATKELRGGATGSW